MLTQPQLAEVRAVGRRAADLDLVLSRPIDRFAAASPAQLWATLIG